MPTLLELATQIVTAQTTASALSIEDILTSLTRIHCTLGQLDSNPPAAFTREPAELLFDIDKSFKKNEVVCMICGKSFKTLGAHLSRSHDISPNEYRKRFAIPKSQPLAAKVHVAAQKQNIVEKLERMMKGKEALAQTKAGNEPVSAKPNPAVENSAPNPVKASKQTAPDTPLPAPPEARRKVGRPRKVSLTHGS